jgi:predicted ATPase
LDDPRFYVITGASGAGKSTLVSALGELGYCVVPEIALTLVQEQEQRGGNLYPWTDLQAFMEAVLVRNIQAYDSARAMRSPVFFDRGLPECLAHMRLLGLRIEPGLAVEAAWRRYAGTVFVAEPWPDIYVCDRWRRAPFERAARSFEPTVAAYVEDGYRLRTIPQRSVRERLAYVLETVRADT